ncbi:MAG: cell division protein FtsH, partial [Actinomycetota bacterium]|nr:cell division protein FtsH [Actinomycetota bacterium]
GREFSSEPDYSDDVAREIDDEIRRVVEEAHQAARDILDQHKGELDHTSEILLRRETIEREEFIQLLEGKDEREVFGADEPLLPQGPPPAEEVPQRKPERKPHPLPRPGLAGGTADIRGLEAPEKPDLP